MQMISDGVFVSTGAYVKVNMGLVVSGKDAAVIDTGYNSDEASRVKQYIDENNLTVKYIILTHRHADHIGNLTMFDGEGVTVLDPSNTSDGQYIALGNRMFKTIKTGGHALDAHMSIELVKENILFAGDVVITNLPTAVAFEGNFKNLIPTLEMLRTKNYGVIVPGHGDITESHEAIRTNIEYLRNVEKYVKRVISEGGTEDDAQKISIEDCIKDTRFWDMDFAPMIHSMTITTAYREFSNQ